MAKKLLSNLSLKLVSVCVAVLVWLIVVNIEDPLVTRTISGVSVSIANESYVESAGLMCLLEESQNTVSVQVTGKRSVVDRMKASDIQAVADLTQIANLDTTPVMVPISVSCTGISAENIKSDPQNMSITLEDMGTGDFLVTVQSGDSQPAKGYEVGSLQANPEKITITGPQSLISKIDKVVANVDVSGLSADTTLTASLKIIDKNQEELSSTQMEYLKYNSSGQNLRKKIKVNVDLWKVATDIQVEASYTGTPADGYKVQEISLTPQIISVAGTDEALELLKENGNKITIPADYIDATNRKADFEVGINIEDLLPDNVKLTTGSNSKIIAAVSVLPQDSQEYSVSTSRIQALHVPDGLQVVYGTDSIRVRVSEGDKSLSEFNTSDIKVSIDFSGSKEGSYEMPVIVEVPDGYEVVEDVTASVEIVKNVEIENTNAE